MIYIIPLQANPNQRTTVTINNQNLTVDVYIVEDGGMYADVYLNADLVIAGARCNAGIAINQYNTPIRGYLTWYTTSGYNPTWQQLGTSAFLMYSDYSIENTLFSKFVAGLTNG